MYIFFLTRKNSKYFVFLVGKWLRYKKIQEDKHDYMEVCIFSQKGENTENCTI